MDDGADEAAILREVQAFAEAWSRGDVKAVAAFYCEDGVRVGPLGDVQHGRPEIERAYQDLLHGRFAGARVMQERGTLRRLTPDLYLWQGGIEIEPPGATQSVKGHVVQLMQRAGDRWLVLEAHPKLFPPPH